ncbi:permease [Chloroflexus aggregans]|uniref:Permease n=1 Tax=Chloroflexus aggregans (strain MD-66 / DSM 9485) TaxID=326427 RepID=B8GAD4_CHLAD|nr:permease [Chloroflexus aggregans]ACL26509.1 permease [Chloroflexus aggregans DSM 9485]
MEQIFTKPSRQSDSRAWLIVVGAAVIWLIAYNTIQPLANWLTYDLIGLDEGSHLGESVAFFLYDVPKILLLLSGMIFVISTLRSFFSPERTRAFLGGKREGVGNILAAGLGVLTPFCSCSAVPLFIGFVEAGIPLGVTFSFLIAAPMVNEVALVMLFGTFGWQVALLYLVAGMSVAIVAGVIIGRLKLERYVEEFVWQIKGGGGTVALENPTWAERFAGAWENTREIVGKVWFYVVIGIAIGAGIHGYVPEDALAGILGRDAWWSVPAGVALGVPLYSNAAGIIPVVQALMAKGAALGTVLAFMMAVVALSLPEMIILRRVLKPQLIAVFVGVVASGIVLVGYLFNVVMAN